MKKAVYALIIITALIVMFLGGFYLGRSTNRYPIQISTLPSPTTVSTEFIPADLTRSVPSETASAVEDAGGKVNINTASAAMLQTLPGIGEVLSQRIIDYRTENGPFSDLAGLLMVDGIGEKKLEAIFDYATVGG